MNKCYDGSVDKLDKNIMLKEMNWIIYKFISGEYLKYHEIVKKFGDSKTVGIITTDNSIYINGLLAVKFNDITCFQFELPSEWVKELFKLTINSEVT